MDVLVCHLWVKRKRVQLVLKKKKLCKARKKVPPVPLIAGTKIVVETLSTSTKANVVWQDGSVEFGKFYKSFFLHMINFCHYLLYFLVI